VSANGGSAGCRSGIGQPAAGVGARVCGAARLGCTAGWLLDVVPRELVGLWVVVERQAAAWVARGLGGQWMGVLSGISRVRSWALPMIRTPDRCSRWWWLHQRASLSRLVGPPSLSGMRWSMSHQAGCASGPAASVVADHECLVLVVGRESDLCSEVANDCVDGGDAAQDGVVGEVADDVGGDWV